eukprot:m.272304 g.272304  ORF g.272304 m.272304 type:complete len:61 (+) comp16270_c0_seq68:575-757(+)
MIHLNDLPFDPSTDMPFVFSQFRKRVEHSKDFSVRKLITAPATLDQIPMNGFISFTLDVC